MSGSGQNGLASLLRDGEVAAVEARLRADPRLARAFLPVERAWGEEQWMPLHVAAEAGRAGVVRVLLELGVKPDSVTRHTTPLHARQTALHLAATDGHANVLDDLLGAGATVEVRDALGRSPLWLAARELYEVCADLLLRHDANPNAADRQGRSALHAALLPGDGAESAEGVTRRLAVVDTLLDGGADPNATCPKEPGGFTPLHRGVTLGPAALPLVERLLDAGADASLADPRHGRTVAELAEHLGHRALLEVVIGSR